MLQRILFVSLLLINRGLHAQVHFTDSTAISTAENYLKNLYYSQKGIESSLFNGKFHYAYNPSIEGIPYFQSGDWQKGTVVYENIPYENILMKYDLVKDQLVVTSKESGSVNISLFSPRVKEFTFSGLTFIYFNKRQDKSSLPEGFYQQLIEGKVTAFAKSSKIITETIVGTTLYRKFEESKKYFIFKGGKYFYIANKNDLLSVLREHRKEIQDLLSAQGLNFRRNPQSAIISAVQLYNQREN